MICLHYPFHSSFKSTKYTFPLRCPPLRRRQKKSNFPQFALNSSPLPPALRPPSELHGGTEGPQRLISGHPVMQQWTEPGTEIAARGHCERCRALTAKCQNHHHFKAAKKQKCFSGRWLWGRSCSPTSAAWLRAQLHLQASGGTEGSHSRNAPPAIPIAPSSGSLFAFSSTPPTAINIAAGTAPRQHPIPSSGEPAALQAWVLSAGTQPSSSSSSSSSPCSLLASLTHTTAVR